MTSERVEVDFGEAYDVDEPYGEDVDDEPATATVPDTTAAPTTDGGEAPTLVYGSVVQFVAEYWRYAYKRTLDPRGRRWAADWWAYDEALMRLDALWRAWEHARQDPGPGLSSWWLQHADPQMAALFDKDGPFADAPELRTERGQPLPHTDPPEGLFPDERRWARQG